MCLFVECQKRQSQTSIYYSLLEVSSHQIMLQKENFLDLRRPFCIKSIGNASCPLKQSCELSYLCYKEQIFETKLYPMKSVQIATNLTLKLNDVTQKLLHFTKLRSLLHFLPQPFCHICDILQLCGTALSKFCLSPGTEHSP